MANDDLQSKAADLMKKVLTVGVGAIFLTEESLRGLVNEFKLPKELLGGILDSASKTKDEFLHHLSRDLMEKIRDRIDPAALLQEFLSKNEIDLHIRVSVKPKISAKKGSTSPEKDEK